MPSGWEDFVHTETLTFPCQCIAEDPPLAQSAAMSNFHLLCARLQTAIIPKCQCRTHLLAFNNKIRFKHFSKTDVLIHPVIELDAIP